MPATTTTVELIYRARYGITARFEDEGGRFLELPVSRISFDMAADIGAVVEVEMPEWLAKNEGLI